MLSGKLLQYVREILLQYTGHYNNLRISQWKYVSRELMTPTLCREHKSI